MIEEVGNIVEVEVPSQPEQPFRFWVETQIKTTCGGCQAQDHCGTGAVARAFSPRVQRLCFESDHSVSVGQQVKLGIPESTLVQLSSLFYLLPIVMLVVVALLMQSLTAAFALESEALVIAGAVMALGGSYWGLKSWLGNRVNENYEPQLLAILPTKVPVKVIG